MKYNLSYQISEYDCGTTCFLNALRCLYTRKNIPIELVKMINNYTLDDFDKKGVVGKCGTSDASIKYMAYQLNNFRNKRNFNISCEVIEKEEVLIDNPKIVENVKNGGVIIMKCMIGIPHFILITDITDDEVYFFDPYYRERPFNDDRIQIVDLDKANRKIKKDAMSLIRNINFSIGEIDSRIALLINKRI